MSIRYACRFVADRRCVTLVEVAADSAERTVRVVTDKGTPWEVALPIGCLPSVAILGSSVVVWAATRMFVMAADKEIIRADLGDEVHAVYEVNGNLCIVGELSVAIYDVHRKMVVDRFDCDEVLGTSWWLGEKLFVQGESGKLYIFHPTSDATHPESAR